MFSHAPGPRLTMRIIISFNFQFNILPMHSPCRYQKYEEKAGSREQVRGHSAQVILSMWQEGDIQGASPCMTFSLFFFTEKEVLGARGRNRPRKPPFYRNKPSPYINMNISEIPLFFDILLAITLL